MLQLMKKIDRNQPQFYRENGGSQHEKMSDACRHHTYSAKHLCKITNSVGMISNQTFQKGVFWVLRWICMGKE